MKGGISAIPIVSWRFSLMLGAVWLVGMAGMAHGADLQACRELRQQRDSLASRAMEQELVLVRTVRSRLCPDLAQHAQGANARDLQFTSIDYAAWNRCRLEAERQLEAAHRIRYRNRQGFTFFTADGATLASQADELSRQWKAEGCD